jgi:succinate dehydrogenase/fumarate reductase flavoprotein subunit
VNEDEYIDQKYDVRKALKAVLEAESSFQLKLRKLKESTASGPAAEEAREYQFMLDSALDAVNSSLDDTRSALSEQEQNQKELKHKPQA